jgi:hypothetical protein
VVLMVTFMTVASWVTLEAGAKKPPRPPAPVPQNGQTQCWDAAGTEIPCDGTGQDGDLQEGIPFPSPRFTDRGDGTVRDNLTGLSWLTDANCFGPQTWETALQAATTMHDTGTPDPGDDCGLMDGSVPGDWRLPNIRELQSLIDFGHTNPGLPSGHPFSGVQSIYYWSSTTDAVHLDQAWVILLNSGGIGDISKVSTTQGGWPVRGGN